MNDILSVQERKIKNKNIIDNLPNIPDKFLDEIYSKFIFIVRHAKSKHNTDRIIQIKYIEDHMKYLDDSNLFMIDQMVDDCMKQKETEEQKLKRLGLEIINKILIILKKPEISKLSNFKNISRDELLVDECVQFIKDNRKYFSECGFTLASNFTILKTPQISQLKCILKTINCELKAKSRSKVINNKRIVDTVYYINEL